MEQVNEKIARLKEIVEESERMVFFGGAGVSTESGIPDFRSVTRNTNIRRKRSSAIASICVILKSFTGFIKIK